MRLAIDVSLEYRTDRPVDCLIQLEAARLPGQEPGCATLRIGDAPAGPSVPGHDGIGHRRWIRPARHLTVDYSAEIAVTRASIALETLAEVPRPALPANVTEYLMDSRFCPGHAWHDFVATEFAGSSGGARVAAMAAWVAGFRYAPGSSDANTTAAETIAKRAGVCRDFAHALVTLVRAAGIPARFASAYAPRVDPPDFHAVAEVWLDGGWHLVDPTGMATPGETAVIGVGRDAADVAFLTSWGDLDFVAQSVRVASI